MKINSSHNGGQIILSCGGGGCIADFLTRFTSLPIKNIIYGYQILNIDKNAMEDLPASSTHDLTITALFVFN